MVIFHSSLILIKYPVIFNLKSVSFFYLVYRYSTKSKIKEAKMKGLIFTFIGAASFFFLFGTSSNLIADNSSKPETHIQSQLTDWVEYVLINGIWYKITHFDNGDIQVVPSQTSNND